MAGISFPPDRIHSLTVCGRPKSEVLEQLQDAHPGSQCHFVEDKMSTLEKVCAAGGLAEWQLYLADWGYNTARERQRAESNDRIRVIDRRQFEELCGVSAAAAAPPRAA